ncbi:MAG: heme-binding protein [Betaproteobacteria bacterium]|nr:heme-binding protein [Betaproteobacteria bacterium]
MKKIVATLSALSLAGFAAFASAQVPSYGPSVTLEQAKKAIAAGQAEAKKNNWPVAIAVLDTSGLLVAFEKMDDTQTASIDVAQDKPLGRNLPAPDQVMEDASRPAAPASGSSTCAAHRWSKAGCRSWSAARSSGASASPASPRRRTASWPRLARMR